MKTRAGGAKVFVNVCHSGEVPPPPPLSPPGLQRLLHAPPSAAGAFRIPMSLGEPHAELDRSKIPPPSNPPILSSPPTPPDTSPTPPDTSPPLLQVVRAALPTMWW